MRIQKTSDELRSTNILPKSRAKSAPPIYERHDKFQFGTNPMKMSAFEKSRAALEVEEREMARKKYIKGIQGCDGGLYEHDQEKSESTCPLNTRGSV